MPGELPETTLKLHMKMTWLCSGYVFRRSSRRVSENYGLSSRAATSTVWTAVGCMQPQNCAV